MKNKLVLLSVLALILLPSTNVSALTGNATIEFSSKDTINVGDTFKVYMDIKYIFGTKGSIVSFNCNLIFDSSMIELVSTTSDNAPFMFQIDEFSNYKLSGLDFTFENGITKNTNVYEFTFRALREGNTTISLDNTKLASYEDYVGSTVIDKNIKIKTKRKEEKIAKIEKEDIKEDDNYNGQFLLKIFNKLLEKLTVLFK